MAVLLTKQMLVQEAQAVAALVQQVHLQLLEVNQQAVAAVAESVVEMIQAVAAALE